MLVKVKNTAPVEQIGKRRISFAGLTGELNSDHSVLFDKKSQAKLPKIWVKHGEIEGYDPYMYVFNPNDLEKISEKGE